MKQLRIAAVILLVLSIVLTGTVRLRQSALRDDTVPVIQCADEPLRIPVSEGRDGALDGITAWDGKDGDLTDRLLVQKMERSPEDGSFNVTYVVADSDNHVVTKTRTLIYTDYVAPRFSLRKELCYVPGETIRIRDRVSAEDVLDGSLNEQIKVTANNLNTLYEGLYPLTLEVTNSFGDTTTLTLDIEIRSRTLLDPVITLTEYLVYLSEGETFRAERYLSGVTGGDRADVKTELPTGGLQKGVNRVVYSCTGSSGAVGKAALYVVVE